MTPTELRAQWTHRRQVLLECGDDKAAKMVDRFITDLDKLTQAESEPLVNLTEASALCGYSARQLSRYVSQGKITNFGESNAPKVRPSHLPMKLSTLRPKTVDGNLETARDRIAKSVINPCT